jgi:hypothetical protein
LPDALSLDHLRHIWCRSAAEYDTLRALLPPEVWARWRFKVTARTDHNLFNRRWVYADEATLMPGSACIRFSPCDSDRDTDCGPFAMRAEVIGDDDVLHTLEEPEFDPAAGDLLLDLSHTTPAYSLRLYLDDALVFAGHCDGDQPLF